MSDLPEIGQIKEDLAVALLNKLGGSVSFTAQELNAAHDYGVSMKVITGPDKRAIYEFRTEYEGEKQ